MLKAENEKRAGTLDLIERTHSHGSLFLPIYRTLLELEPGKDFCGSDAVKFPKQHMWSKATENELQHLIGLSPKEAEIEQGMDEI